MYAHSTALLGYNVSTLRAVLIFMTSESLETDELDPGGLWISQQIWQSDMQSFAELNKMHAHCASVMIANHANCDGFCRS